MQQNAAETVVRNGISAQRGAQRQGAELARQLFEAQFDAFESAVDGDEFRATVDRGFDEGADLTQQLLNEQFEQGSELVQQVVDAQFEAFQSAFDDEFDVRAAVDDQFEEFNETQNEAWDEFEAEFLSAMDDLSEQQRELFARSADAFLDAQRDAERRTVEGVQETRAVAETARESAESVADEATDAAERQVDATGEAVEAQLEDLHGLGPAYADRLRAAGVESIADLSETNAETIAESVEVAESQAEEWIEAAESRA